MYDIITYSTNDGYSGKFTNKDPSPDVKISYDTKWIDLSVELESPIDVTTLRGWTLNDELFQGYSLTGGSFVGSKGIVTRKKLYTSSITARIYIDQNTLLEGREIFVCITTVVCRDLERLRIGEWIYVDEPDICFSFFLTETPPDSDEVIDSEGEPPIIDDCPKIIACSAIIDSSEMNVLKIDPVTVDSDGITSKDPESGNSSNQSPDGFSANDPNSGNSSNQSPDGFSANDPNSGNSSNLDPNCLDLNGPSGSAKLCNSGFDPGFGTGAPGTGGGNGGAPGGIGGGGGGGPGLGLNSPGGSAALGPSGLGFGEPGQGGVGGSSFGPNGVSSPPYTFGPDGIQYPGQGAFIKFNPNAGPPAWEFNPPLPTLGGDNGGLPVGFPGQMLSYRPPLDSSQLNTTDPSQLPRFRDDLPEGHFMDYALKEGRFIWGKENLVDEQDNIPPSQFPKMLPDQKEDLLNSWPGFSQSPDAGGGLNPDGTSSPVIPAGTQPFDPEEAESWAYDPNQDTFGNENPTQTFSGRTSPDVYNGYELKAKLSSDTPTDGPIAVIAAEIQDPITGKKNNLSVIRRPKTLVVDPDNDDGLDPGMATPYDDPSWGLVYNYGQPDEKWFDVDNSNTNAAPATNPPGLPGVSHDDWVNSGPTTVRIVKENEGVYAETSQFGSDQLDPETGGFVSFDDFPELEQFKDKKTSFGFGSKDQPAKISEIEFETPDLINHIVDVKNDQIHAYVPDDPDELIRAGVESSGYYILDSSFGVNDIYGHGRLLFNDRTKELFWTDPDDRYLLANLTDQGLLFGDPILNIQGTNPNSNEEPYLRLNGNETYPVDSSSIGYESHDSGLSLTILDSNGDLVGKGVYNTSSDPSASNNLADQISDMTPGDIGILTSKGDYGNQITEDLKNVAFSHGLNKLYNLSPEDPDPSYAAIFQKTNSDPIIPGDKSFRPSKALEVTTGDGEYIPANIKAGIADGTFYAYTPEDPNALVSSSNIPYAWIDSNKDLWAENGIMADGGRMRDVLYLKEGNGGGLSWDDNEFGGSGDTAKIYLDNNGGENQSLTLKVTNDSSDIISLEVPDLNGVKQNGFTNWHEGNHNHLIIRSVVDNSGIGSLVFDSNTNEIIYDNIDNTDSLQEGVNNLYYREDRLKDYLDSNNYYTESDLIRYLDSNNYYTESDLIRYLDSNNYYTESDLLNYLIEYNYYDESDVINYLIINKYYTESDVINYIDSQLLEYTLDGESIIGGVKLSLLADSQSATDINLIENGLINLSWNPIGKIINLSVDSADVISLIDQNVSGLDSSNVISIIENYNILDSADVISISGPRVVNIEDLSDVSNAPPDSGDYLKWNGTIWEPTRGDSFELLSDSVGYNSVQIYLNQLSEAGAYPNSTFSDTTQTTNGNQVTLNGWIAITDQIRLGIDSIGGFISPSDPTPNPIGQGGQVSSGDGTLDPSMNFYSEFATLDGKDCIRLYSSGSVSTFGDVSHGPYLVSQDYSYFAQGSKVGFSWRAAAGGDAYDVFAYLLKDDGTVQILLNETQAGTSGDTGWLTVNDTVSQSGNYKFVFVSGTFDYSFGGVAGASLYVTDIKSEVGTISGATNINGGTGILVTHTDPNTITITNTGGGSGGATDLDDLLNVDTTGAINGSILKYNGSQWVAGVDDTSSGGANSLDDLGDVDVSTATTGNVLEFNGTNWVPGTVTSGGTYTAGDGLVLASNEFSVDTSVLRTNVSQTITAGKKFNNGIILQLGTDGDMDMYHNAFDNIFDLRNGDLLIREMELGVGTTKFTFERSTGNFTAAGDVTAFSDERLKSNVKTLNNGLDKVKSMRGVTFEKNGKPGIGVIAQEIESILPEVVHQSDEYKSVAYGNMVAVLIEAVKELSDRIEKLESQI